MAQFAKKTNNNNETFVEVNEEDIINGQIGIEEVDEVPEGAEVVDYVEINTDTKASKKETKQNDSKDNEIKKLKSELEERDKKLDEFSKNFAAMQAQMELLMKGAMTSRVEVQEEDIAISCRAIAGGVLATSDGRYNYKFECEEVKYISSYDLKEIFKENGLRDNKKSFERGLFYFLNDEDYKKFKIRKLVDLSFDNVKRIVMLPIHDMIDEVNLLTNNLINFQVTHLFQYQIVKMLIDTDNPLRDWNYESRVALEKYLRQDFNTLMASVGAVELLGRKSFRK